MKKEKENVTRRRGRLQSKGIMCCDDFYDQPRCGGGLGNWAASTADDRSVYERVIIWMQRVRHREDLYSI